MEETKNLIEIDGEFYKPDEVVYSEWQQKDIVKGNAEQIWYNGDYDWGDVDCVSQSGMFVWVEDEGIQAYEDDTFYCDVASCHYANLDARTVSYCDVVGHEDNFAEDYDWRYVERGLADGYYLHCDDAAYCEDIDEHVHIDDAHWCENEECYYWDESNVHDGNVGIDVCEYHSSKDNVCHIIDCHAQFTIGFEVEKKYFNTDYGVAEEVGDEVGEQKLFAGYETDSSCGVEAVTHILPLSSPRSENRKKVFEYIDEAEKIIGSATDTSCGGHMTIQVRTPRGEDLHQGMRAEDGYDTVDKLRQKIALLYALYRHRLKRTYCESNKPVKKENNYKYSPVHVKGNKVEFRIPSAIKNTKQMKLRYDLMYKMLHLTYNRPTSFEVYLQKVKHIVMKMYKGDEQKVEQIYSIARDFRRYLIAEEVTDLTDPFINYRKEE